MLDAPDEPAHDAAALTTCLTESDSDEECKRGDGRAQQGAIQQWTGVPQEQQVWATQHAVVHSSIHGTHAARGGYHAAALCVLLRQQLHDVMHIVYRNDTAQVHARGGTDACAAVCRAAGDTQGVGCIDVENREADGQRAQLTGDTAGNTNMQQCNTRNNNPQNSNPHWSNTTQRSPHATTSSEAHAALDTLACTLEVLAGEVLLLEDACWGDGWGTSCDSMTHPVGGVMHPCTYGHTLCAHGDAVCMGNAGALPMHGMVCV